MKRIMCSIIVFAIAFSALTMMCLRSPLQGSSTANAHIESEGVVIWAVDTIDETWCRILDDVDVKVAVVDVGTRILPAIPEWLEENGFQVVATLNEYADPDEYDGMVIPGGNDVDPLLYGQEPDPTTYGVNRQGDELQIQQIKEFADKGIPVLGVCRGCQVLNVAYGGSLIQDLGDSHEGYRDVKVDGASWLYRVYGDTVPNAWHHHHQCVDEVGDGLVVTQWDAQDGIIEGIEHQYLPLYAIQWHPEDPKMGEVGDHVAIEFRRVCAKRKLCATLGISN